MKTYCVREKRKTECVPESEQLVTMKNGRNAVRCICASCGANKFSIVSGTAMVPKAPKDDFNYKRTWEKILTDDESMRKWPITHTKFKKLFKKPKDDFNYKQRWEKILTDDASMRKWPVTHTKFKKLLRIDPQWERILKDDMIMRKRNNTDADDKFKRLMKQYEIDRINQSLKRSVGRPHTREQQEAIGRQNLRDYQRRKTKEILDRRWHNHRIDKEIDALAKMYRKEFSQGAPVAKLNMIRDEINRLEANLQ